MPSPCPSSPAEASHDSLDAPCTMTSQANQAMGSERGGCSDAEKIASSALKEFKLVWMTSKRMDAAGDRRENSGLETKTDRRVANLRLASNSGRQSIRRSAEGRELIHCRCVEMMLR